MGFMISMLSVRSKVCLSHRDDPDQPEESFQSVRGYEDQQLYLKSIDADAGAL